MTNVSRGLAAQQHDPAHWPAADALDAGDQLRHPALPPQPSWRIRSDDVAANGLTVLRKEN